MELEINSYVVGQRVVGSVIDVEKDVIYMDIGASCDAKIDKAHYSYETENDFRKMVKIGDEIKTMITFVSDEQILLSRLPFEKEAQFEKAKAQMETGEQLTITFEKFNRGGLEHKGIFTYFMPVSQIGIKGAEPKDYINKPFTVVITDTNEERQQVIVSARKVLDAEYKKNRDISYESLEIGTTIEAKITKVLDAGLELRYQDMIRGFVPRKELSHLRVPQVSDAYTIGDTVSVKVIEVKKDFQFIASVKALLPTPWEQFMATHKQDDVIKGTVKRMIEIGAFVEIVPGVDGLLHKSEISYDDFVNFKDIISIDEEVEVKIIAIDEKAHRISLSIKKLQADPWDGLWEKYHEGDIIPVTVKRIERNHMWVNVIQYVDAMLYRRETLLEDNQELADYYKEGQELSVKITELNPKRRRIVVSLAAIVRDEEQKQLQDYRERIQSEVEENVSTLKSKFQTALGDLSVEAEKVAKVAKKKTTEVVKKATKDATEIKEVATEKITDAEVTTEEVKKVVKKKAKKVVAEAEKDAADMKAVVVEKATEAAEKTLDAIETTVKVAKAKLEDAKDDNE